MFRATPKQTKSGKYCLQVSVGKNAETGKSIMKTFTSDTPFGVIKKAEDYLSGKREEESTFTVGDCIDKYIDMKENILSPSSIEGYRNKRRNCLQSIMNIPVSDLTSTQIQSAINQDSIKLSPKTIRCAYGVLLSSLKMFRPDFIPVVSLPAKQNKIKTLPEASKIIKAVKGTEIELPCLLAMWLSLRMSEVRGIRYQDISGNVLTIRNTIVTVAGEHIKKEMTKTFKSTRQLQIPDYIMNLIEKQKTGNPDSEYLTTMTGQAIYKRFSRILEHEGLQHMTFHDLRHMNASVMLMLGVPEKYAMERGGWSSNYTLQNVYQHTFTEKRKEVDKQIDDYFNCLISNSK